MTLCAMLGTTAFTRLKSFLVYASLLPSLSILSAASRRRSRDWSISARISATCCTKDPMEESFSPKAMRESARWHIRLSARSAWPIIRMQWWMRPGPRRSCAISKPRPSPIRTLDSGTRTSSKRISMCPFGQSSSPKTIIGLTRVMPGVSSGTSICDCCRYALAPGLVFPMRIMILQSTLAAPVIQCLRPFMTHSSPSLRMSMLMLPASLLATAGSVMA
mmetsp:Transcript_58333/g.126102  ORF Transcript_58333/g.126102 Transcript_58333/m.126102 type:complete len:219 (+) Transcript_58333:235-891(+)